jgi:hypothetical protein
MDLKALIKDPKSYLVGVVLIFAGEKIGEYVIKGTEADMSAFVQERVIEELGKEENIKKLMQNPEYFRMMLNSPQVKEYTSNVGMELRDGIIEDITKEDSTKINQNAFLGKELGIRDEAVTPLLLELLKDYKEGKIATKEDIRPRRNPTTLEL